MTLLSLIIALLIEQVRPLPVQQLVVGPLRRLAGALAERFNDGQARNGRIAWVLVVALATAGCAAAFFVLWHMHPALAFVFNIVVLYFTMGFRQESHFFTDIHLALRMGEIDRARMLLSEWRGGQYHEASSSEVARLAIEQALIASHRSVFGVAFWFVLLPGASGALMYRLARFFDDEWGTRTDNEFGSFGRFARQAFVVIDSDACPSLLPRHFRWRAISRMRWLVGALRQCCGRTSARLY